MGDKSIEYEHHGTAGPYKIVLDSDKGIDRVWGIERNRYSPAYGLKTVPVIILWRQPTIKAVPENLTGSLQHGDEVNVIRSIQRDRETFCYVKARVIHKGATYNQRGWIAERLLETAGAKHYKGGNP